VYLFWRRAVLGLCGAGAVAMAYGRPAGLGLLLDVDATGTLAGYRLLPATRADLLRRLGRASEAADSYRAAIDLAATDSERRYLTRRLQEVTRPA
jgi:RNA polymerase sigma-70 factor (ECF subfamily)